STEDSFSIPNDEELWPKIKSKLGAKIYMAWILAPDFTADGTWPAILVRESIDWLAACNDYQKYELVAQLEAPSNGPLCCLVMSELLLRTGQNEWARLFATRGLEQLDPQKFQGDLVGLSDQRGLIGRCLLQWADILRNSDILTVGTISNM